jgi:DivIVA domain-containing protein
MIDMTPLDVRNKRGDFKKIMRGYDPPEVDVFLELVAERLETLVRENLQLRERTQTLQERVTQQGEREQAVQDALVTAQELRADIQSQSQREADHVMKEAESESRRLIADAEAEVRRLLADGEAQVRDRVRGTERRIDDAHGTMQELERRRGRFLKEMRGLLLRELDVVQVEEERLPFEERAIDLDLGSRGRSAIAGGAQDDTGGAQDAPTGAQSAPAGAQDAPAGAQDAPTGAQSAPAGAQDAPGVENDSDVEGPHPAMDVFAEAELEAEPDSEGENDDRGEVEASKEGGPGEDAQVVVDIADIVAGGDAVAEVGGDTAAKAGGDTAAEDDSPLEGTAENVVEGAGAAAGSPEPLGGTVDVTDLQPVAGDPPAVAPALDPEPSSLELEFMAGAAAQAEVQHTGNAGEPFSGVPDLETVLAEAGIEEVVPPDTEEIAPPPFSPTDNLILFDPEERDPKR